MKARKKIIRNPPEIGRQFTHRAKGKIFTMTVVQTADGIRYKVEGKVFGSPSSAAKYIAGHEENGYEYWHID